MIGRRFALDARLTAFALALMIAIVGMPILNGWVVADSHCGITMDICHPAQATDIGHAPLLAPKAQPCAMNQAPREVFLAINDAYRESASRLCDTPDLPPPKTSA